MADLIADGLQLGCLDFTVAAIPETCGHAMELPDIILNKGASLPSGATESSFPFHAASMSTPGAAISGYKNN